MAFSASSKTLLFTVLLISCVSALCSNMEQYNETDPAENEWRCIPCGGIFSCKTQGASKDLCTTTSVPGCNLPQGATQWTCCRNCDTHGSDTCAFTSSEVEDDRWCRDGCIATVSVVGAMVVGTAIFLSVAGFLKYRAARKSEESIPFATTA
jgi:hypothetical protein